MRSWRAIIIGGLVAASMGCSTSVGLMEPPPTAPPAGAVAGAGNRPPSVKIEATPAGATFQLRANAYDPDDDPLTIQWTATAAEGTLSSTTTTRTVWTPAAGAATATISVTVTDSRGASASDTTTITVRKP